MLRLQSERRDSVVVSLEDATERVTRSSQMSCWWGEKRGGGKGLNRVGSEEASVVKAGESGGWGVQVRCRMAAVRLKT